MCITIVTLLAGVIRYLYVLYTRGQLLSEWFCLLCVWSCRQLMPSADFVYTSHCQRDTIIARGTNEAVPTTRQLTYRNLPLSMGECRRVPQRISNWKCPSGVEGQSPVDDLGTKSSKTWWSSANYTFHTTTMCSERKQNDIFDNLSIIGGGFIQRL